ncbi:MAG: MAPEG family protein [Deltaproteobacteria bacterium]|nr:MAPEG family protein [Deltaproteobacteria bacterium]NND27108.1 MAPEG family protein [Myxococcales bacterium]MBT8466699.1 MAPEG family protein [Deltaproteobacteria bacterium]MBT8483710.1 MAPEG family protein [Deltaproteobacteria bacterium]NNK09236.1 MAPEG family protein [Myxococcales bacterium]
MSPSALALVGYVAWTILLASTIVFYRTALVLKKERAANDFLPSGEDVSPFSNRLCRAQANCFENLPAFAALILLALATGHTDITDPLARWVLVARVAQSTVHLISTSEMAVSLRALLLLVQLGVEAYWVVQFGLLGFA